MNEFAYILSDDLLFIKQVIDYSLISSKFTLNGISTGGNLDVTALFEANVTLLIIDEHSLSEAIVLKLKEFHKQFKEKEVALIFIGDYIGEVAKEILDLFYISKFSVKRGNIFDVLFLIEKICEQRNHVEKMIDAIIANHLQVLNIKSKVFGFTYLKLAISLQIENSQMKMRTICDKIAREYRVTSSRVDRCMRTSIESAYQKNEHIYASLYDFSSRPTCKNFISKIAEHITEKS